jgi:EF-P beta-lysylation protein EpmB
MHWRQILKNNFTRWEALCEFLELDEPLRAKILQRSSFPLNLPFRLASKIEKNTLEDPILRQFVPLTEEEKCIPGYSTDPLEESIFCKTSKLLRKYEGRVLLITTSACAMHCRFCFRRHFPYESNHKLIDKELEIIAKDPSIKEVILSGGDPLSLSNEALNSLLTELDKIPHVKRVRFHTRFPIGIPERLEPEFLSLLENRRYQPWIVIHCNHVRELDDDVALALKNVIKRGVPVLNQSVLLRNVNDSIDALEALSERLVNCGITPYYLHQSDRVKGAHHFDVDEEIGLALIEELQTRTSGYAVPKYVREISGQRSKTSLESIKIILSEAPSLQTTLQD